MLLETFNVVGLKGNNPGIILIFFSLKKYSKKYF